MTIFIGGNTIKHRALNKVRRFGRRPATTNDGRSSIKYSDGIRGVGTPSELVMNDPYVRSNIFKFLSPGMVTELSHIKKFRTYIKFNNLNIKTGASWSNKRLLLNLIKLRRLLDTYPTMFSKNISIDKLVHICNYCLKNVSKFNRLFEELESMIMDFKRIELSREDPRKSKIEQIQKFIEASGKSGSGTIVLENILVKDFDLDDYIGMIIYDELYEEQAMVVGYDPKRESCLQILYQDDEMDECFVTRQFVDQNIIGFGNFINFGNDSDSDTDTESESEGEGDPPQLANVI